MYVTKLELWNDTGFVENSAEYPNLSDTLTNPDYTYTDLHPAKEDLFSYFKIKGVSYETLINVSYARVTYDNLGYPVYMWVDNVACISESPSKLVGVRVHADLWRTYLADSSLQYGLVTKRIRGTADPIQSCPYRYRKLASSYTDLIHTEDLGMKYLWGIVSYVEEDEETHTITAARILTCPISTSGSAVYFKMSPNATNLYTAVTRDNWISSTFDEVLGIAPTSISAAFVSPLPPFQVYKGSGTSDDPIIFASTDSSSSEKKSTSETGSVGITYLARYANGKSTLVDPLDSSKSKISSGLLGVYGCSYVTFTIDGTVHTYDNAKVNNSICFAPIDQWVASTFGEDVFKNLQDGDTVEFSNAYTVINSYSIDKVGTKLVDGSLVMAMECTGTGTSDDRKFTFSNRTFGLRYVVVDGYPNSISLELNTSTPVISAQDFGVVSGRQAMVYRKDGKCNEYSWSLPTDACTTDDEEMVILDLDGNPIATTPWGLSLKNYSMRCVLSTVSAYVQIRFDGKSSLAEGLCVNIPCPAVDVTSNSWSDYVYSGQRDYDIQQRKIASQQALVSGITGGLQNTVSTAVMGGLGGINKGALNEADALFRDKAMASVASHPILGGSGATEEKFYNQILSDYGSAMKGVRSAAQMTGKLAGGAMLGVSVGGSLVDYAAAQYFNGKLQGIEDTLQAKQLDTVQTPGGGWDFFYHGMTVRLTSLKPDDYSVTNFQNNITYNGITCSEPTADCSAYKDYTGPVQIQNLIVTGDIPVQAKYLIANTYAKGIRMKCVNEKPDYDITASSLLTTTSISADTYVLYNNTDYRYKINCVANDEIRDQYIVEAGQNVTVTLEAGDVISTLYYDKIWIANPNTVTVL